MLQLLKAVPPAVLGYRREHGEGAHSEQAHVLLNLGDRPMRVDLRDAPHAAVYSNLRDGAQSSAPNYELAPYEAIVLTG